MMGADIHLFLERKMKSGKWACVSNLNKVVHVEGLDGLQPTNSLNYGYYKLSGRNYQLFGALASVRGDGLEPRGMPDDPSDIVQHEADGWMHDAHSHSWLYADEFISIYNKVWLEPKDDEPLDQYSQTLLTDGKDLAVREFLRLMCSPMVVEDEDQPEDFRFVFWFDN
jgi:hypothetical protein